MFQTDDTKAIPVNKLSLTKFLSRNSQLCTVKFLSQSQLTIMFKGKLPTFKDKGCEVDILIGSCVYLF